jgi:hypothetical protein
MYVLLRTCDVYQRLNCTRCRFSLFTAVDIQFSQIANYQTVSAFIYEKAVADG